METSQYKTTDPGRGRGKVNQDSAQLHAFISNLNDLEWQSVQDRMMDPMSQTDMVQVSGRIQRVVSQLVLQLVDPALEIQLQPEDQSRASDSVSKKQPLGNNDSSSAVTVKPLDLQKYFRITKDSLKPLNQGLCELAAESQDSAETEGSEVKAAAMKSLALAAETLANVTDNVSYKDVDILLETTTREVMFAIADSMSSCQEKERRSARILRDLATRVCSEFAELQGSGDQPEPSVQNQMNISDEHMKPYPLRVSFKKVSSDLAEFRASCLQVLKGLLAMLLARFSPSLSLMAGPHIVCLPTLESAASDILDIVINGVKEICRKKKPQKCTDQKTGVTKQQVSSTATEVKVALQKKLRDFLTYHRRMIAKWEDIQEEQTANVISSAVTALLHQVDIHSNDRGRSTLIKLEDLIREDKLCIFSSLLKSSLSPLLSSPVSPAVQVRLICGTAVKHLLRLFFLPPLSWGMGLVLRVQSSHSSAVRYRETALLYDDIISQYAQLMCEQVMSSFGRSPEDTDDSERQHKKKRKNIVHFFQKLPRKIQNNWEAQMNWIDTLTTGLSDTGDEEGGEDSSEEQEDCHLPPYVSHVPVTTKWV